MEKISIRLYAQNVMHQKGIYLLCWFKRIEYKHTKIVKT